MLQILSTSNETSTGAELVQNGNFSEIGSDLVTNGDFSAAGSNLVSNPNFTDLPLGADWTLGTGWSIGDSKAISTLQSGSQYLTQSSVVESGKSYKVTFEVIDYTSGSVKATVSGDEGEARTAIGTYTEYLNATGTTFSIKNQSGAFIGSISNISVQELGEGWTVTNADATHYVEFIETGARFVLASTSPLVELKQTTFQLLANKSYKLTVDMTRVSGSVKVDTSGVSELFDATTSGTNNTRYIKPTGNIYLSFYRQNAPVDITFHSVTVQELDPNGYWTIGTGWSIGDTKAISTVTGSNSDITQSILTAGKTYRTVYEIVDYTAGTAQAVVTGSDGADAVALGTFTEDLTTTGTDFSIRSKLGTFDGAVSSVSVKLLGTYDDQSIYVTAADVQTIAQASVYYLVELTSMGSKNSLYFLPSSVVPNNGRYTKLNFTVISKDALPQPTVGIISFYDSVGGFDTYPMGFYEFRIYEQTSSTNLDPLLATGLLEKGFAFVRDFSGNMQELTDGFKEYNPTLTQYVYSK